MELGLRVPRDVSLISRQDDTFLHHLRPSIAAYEYPVSHYAARVARMVVSVTRLGSVAARHALVMGEFRPGDSLAERR